MLWQAAQRREVLDLEYDSYYERSHIHTRVRPYRLIFISRGWYLIAYSEMHGQPRTFKVDRIICADATGEIFEKPAPFDITAYFGNAWRMIRGDRRYHVCIRFSPKVAGNVEEVLWHPTQRTHHLDDGSMRYEVDVDGIEEMSWWVLSYGREAVVEAPPELRRIIAEHARAMAALHEDS